MSKSKTNYHYVSEGIKAARRHKIMKFLVQAIMGFFLWTLILTPYMVIVIGITFDQYILWLLASVLISPPASIIVAYFTDKVYSKLLKKAIYG